MFLTIAIAYRKCNAIETDMADLCHDFQFGLVCHSIDVIRGYLFCTTQSICSDHYLYWNYIHQLYGSFVGSDLLYLSQHSFLGMLCVCVCVCFFFMYVRSSLHSFAFVIAWHVVSSSVHSYLFLDRDFPIDQYDPDIRYPRYPLS